MQNNFNINKFIVDSKEFTCQMILLSDVLDTNIVII